MTGRPNEDSEAMLDRELIVWGSDYTPSVDCQECGAELMADPNGNGPLYLTARDLLAALAIHVCGRSDE